ncbi:hypothetical protein GJ744_001816 [Endocarpon pusillum]|uniref:Autophagy-related protein 29 n=1 Tax=Endocarpon pusillum TaxID=364733 RepID=A0A8H7E8L2_9EURO|nr:hypothetical protein GJ744_001816 [Endocarpon pusillum]
MSEVENHFTVFIRLPFNRGDFVDPPPVAWNAAKEKELWEIISRQSKSNELNWKELAERFDVTQPFLLQKAAWLYERQLSQVRAQMRKVGSRQSSTPSPAPGSMSGSAFGGQAMKRDGSGGSQVPSRLSTHARDSPSLRGEVSVPGTPNKVKAPQTLKMGSAATVSHSRSGSITEQRMPLAISRHASKDASTRPTDLRPRATTNQQEPLTRSPKEMQLSSPSSSEQSENETASKPTVSNRLRPSSARNRPQPTRTHQSSHSDEGGDGEDEDEDDSSPFLPFAAASSASTHHQTQDPSATLRGGFGTPPRAVMPTTTRRGTMERIPYTSVRPAVLVPQQMTSSASSNSSGPGSSAPAVRPSQLSAPRHTNPPSSSATPLSPRRAAELAAAGLSPLRRPGSGREGSDGSPSMGSSFSDLDDASVTQSALEEALLSNMQHGGSGGVASRMSTISQALRSRVFDQRGR